jgi:hypothetical protein
MTLATACFDTDSSVAEDSSNKFWCRKPQSDDSGKNDNQDSDNDSWPSSASSGSISINFGHEASTNGKLKILSSFLPYSSKPFADISKYF